MIHWLTHKDNTFYVEIGETNLFEILNQLNKLLCKMIHSFEVLERPHASDACRSKLCKNNKNSCQNMQKNSFYKPIAKVLLKL